MARIDYPVFTSEASTPGDAAIARAIHTMWEAGPVVHVAPTIENVSPAPGAIRATDALTFDLLGNGKAIRRAIIMAQFQGLSLWEVIHDGESFSPAYSRQSSRDTITDGYHYSLLRMGGWPASPIITPYAMNIDGDENA